MSKYPACKITVTFLSFIIFSAGGVFAPAFAKTYNKDYVGETEIHRAVFEDTLIHLARDNNLGFVELRAANPELDPWIPGAGVKIILPKRHILPEAPREGIVINLPEMRLYFFEKPGEPPLSYPIGIGREGLKTPTGSTRIIRKKDGPSWRPTERMRQEDPDLPAVVPPGPSNPLGTHALYLGWPQYLIHGTNKPYGIGRRISSGCIRLYPEGIVDLFGRVPVGSPVTVVDQPVKVGWIADKMYIEVHPTQEQSVSIETEGILKSYEITAEDIKRITAKAGEYADHIDWEKVRDAVRAHRGFPVAVLDKNREAGKWSNDEFEELLSQADVAAEEVIVPEQVIESEEPESDENDMSEQPAPRQREESRQYNFNN